MINYNMPGQIKPDTAAGEWLIRLAGRNDVINIVEFGTWSGLGSTMCVLDGIGGENKRFISIEPCKEMFSIAKANLAGRAVELLNGTIVSRDDLNWFDHDDVNSAFDGEVGPLVDRAKSWFNRAWLQVDIDNSLHCDYVLDYMPSSIDLLILDGGEYSSYPEWLKLGGRSRFVFLDDTCTFKCFRIRREILRSGDFVMLADDLDDRHGYSVFERRTRDEVRVSDKSSSLIG